MSSTATLTPQRFFLMLDTLRKANERYSLVAILLNRFYCQTRTHSVRIKAWKLGLTIDTGRAKRCPQIVVSVLPLPIIEVDSSPVVVRRPLPVYPPGGLEYHQEASDAPAVQMPHAPLMTCVSLPEIGSDMGMDSPNVIHSAFSSEEGDSDEMDISPSPSPSSPPSLFLSSSPSSGQGSNLPTPPDSAREFTSEGLKGSDQPKIMWRIMREPTLSIHPYIDGRALQRL